MADPQYKFDGIADAPAAPKYDLKGVDDQPAAKAESPNTIGEAIRHFWQTGPVSLGQMLPFPKAAGGSGVDHPLMPSGDPGAQGAPNFVMQMHGVKKQADDLWAKGDKVGATAKYVESVIPFLGPLMSSMGDEAQKSHWAALLGDTAGLASTTAVTADPVASANVVRAGAARGGRGMSTAGAALETTAGSPKAQGLGLTVAAEELFHGRLKEAAFAAAIPKGAQYLGKGMRLLGDILADTKPLTKVEAQALVAKRFDPSIRTNKPAQAAITQALETRGPGAPETPLALTQRLKVENVALTADQAAAAADPRVSGLPPAESPAPAIRGPQGVPASAVAPDASARAATIAQAVQAVPPAPYETAITQAKAAVAEAPKAVAPSIEPTMANASAIFTKLKVQPLKAEVNNAVQLVKMRAKSGSPITLEEAVMKQIEGRPGIDTKAAAALSRKLGLPTDAEMEADLASRGLKTYGQKS